MPQTLARVLLTLPVAALLLLPLTGCDDGDGPPTVAGAASSLWVALAVENEVDRGAIAYATFRYRDAHGDGLELPEGDRITCNGRGLEKTVEAWSLLTYYKTVVPDLGEGGAYAFAWSRADGETYEGSVTMPSSILVDEESTDTEVQPGRDAVISISGGAADEVAVSLVAECLAPVTVTLEGDAETATVPGDRIECACIAGGLVPPCDGLVRAQRINRSSMPEAFAGGETLGVQRHEVDIHVIE